MILMLSLLQGMEGISEVKVFSILLHTHLAGVGVRVRHFRDGEELPWLDSDMTYDFNYQEHRPTYPEVTVKKVGLTILPVA